MILMDFRPVLVISGTVIENFATVPVHYGTIGYCARYDTGPVPNFKKKMKKGSDIHTYSHTHTRDNVSIIYRIEKIELLFTVHFCRGYPGTRYGIGTVQYRYC